jgi:hypothetical protein
LNPLGQVAGCCEAFGTDYHNMMENNDHDIDNILSANQQHEKWLQMMEIVFGDGFL